MPAPSESEAPAGHRAAKHFDPDPTPTPHTANRVDEGASAPASSPASRIHDAGSATTFVDPLRTTASALLPAKLADGAARRALQLAGEAFTYTVLSCALLLGLGLAEGGLISIFLVAAPLTDRLVVLLEENRNGIYVLQRTSRRANQRAAAGLLWLFLGIAVGYAAVAAWLGERGTLRLFAFAVEAANLHGESLLQRSFSQPLAIFANNLRVGLVVLCLGFIYRAYGGMLALAWNACVWASVLTVLLLRTATGPIGSRMLLAVAFAPHLILEAGSYVLIALAAIFASKALATYDRRDARLRSALKASSVLAALAVLGLAAATVFESWLLPVWVATIAAR